MRDIHAHSPILDSAITLTGGHPPQKTHSRKRGQRIKKRERRNLKRAFLRQYQENPCVSDVCKELGIARNTFYAWCEKDSKFAQAFFAEAQYITMERMCAAQKEFESMFPPLDEEFLHNASDRELAALMRIHTKLINMR